jgi:hypothetical protein
MFDYLMPAILTMLLAFDLMLITYVSNLNRNVRSELLHLQLEVEQHQRAIRKLIDDNKKAPREF